MDICSMKWWRAACYCLASPAWSETSSETGTFSTFHIYNISVTSKWASKSRPGNQLLLPREGNNCRSLLHLEIRDHTNLQVLFQSLCIRFCKLQFWTEVGLFWTTISLLFQRSSHHDGCESTFQRAIQRILASYFTAVSSVLSDTANLMVTAWSAYCHVMHITSAA